ncbi:MULTISPECIES: MarR family winged helix-turn-helix transcriptional regulator [Flavobacteriales]|uniref:MarR family transcriptional regulator n=1 Tax=Empedobacter falsenii TaxID=343874 RepID=A0AAW7DQK1_9FLAO|nr:MULTISPECIES: MarR family transcriptional regulator [Flavobacteriales]MDM1036351.1 MarR family transcriptional regulator [Myroides odoratimimus]MDM1060644.1 MarR family transcriptional regulator [Myroides odoratimimus]MDM1381046.1 MarR family transcriptional regulator [Myroides marinus]MDM1388312.1 MarR family transcriptional regulator [Myroides marinus]MDM1395527.1 MarR family transcriptional regulator [Myroides marinus]
MPDKEKIINLRKLSQLYAYTSIQMHESIGRKIGLTGTDHKYLGFLIQKGQMTAGELALLTGLTTGSVTGLIDRFENKKLVKRQPDKTDRRKIIIVPNIDRITKLVTPFYSNYQNKTHDLFVSFNSDELNILEKYFHKALELMNKEIEKVNEKQ